MKQYTKLNGQLVGNNFELPLFSHMPLSSTIAEGQVIFVEHEGIFIKTNGVLVQLINVKTAPTDFIGEIRAMPFASAPNNKWLLCNGGTFSSSTYPALYALLGNSNRLPDLREAHAVGIGANDEATVSNPITTLGGYKDRKVQGHGHQIDEQPHTHTLENGSHGHVSHWSGSPSNTIGAYVPFAPTYNQTGSSIEYYGTPRGYQAIYDPNSDNHSKATWVGLGADTAQVSSRADEFKISEYTAYSPDNLRLSGTLTSISSTINGPDNWTTTGTRVQTPSYGVNYFIRAKE